MNSGLDYNLIAQHIMEIGYTYNVKSKNVYEKKTKETNILEKNYSIKRLIVASNIIIHLNY